MTSLTRYSTALTTGSDDIPLATSSSPQLRPSHRVIPRPGRLSSPRPRQPRPDARRNRSNTLTTAATTPVRGPPIIDKGKGVDRGPRATSVDPNLAPFRYPSYTAVDLGNFPPWFFAACSRRNYSSFNRCRGTYSILPDVFTFSKEC